MGRLATAVLLFTVALTGCAANASSYNPTKPTIAPGSATTAHLPPGVDALITVDSSSHGVGIPRSFLGFGLEVSALCQMISLDNNRGNPFENLFRNLGPGVFRVGGRSSEFTRWKPHGLVHCSPKATVLTAPEIRTFFRFAKRIGWKVIWSLPLKIFQPSIEAREASTVARAAGSSLLAFDLGNEPDLYVSRRDRPADWTYADYIAQWQALRAAVLRAVPRAKFVGPETCCTDDFFTSFAVSAEKQVSALTFHYYGGAGPKWLIPRNRYGCHPGHLLHCHRSVATKHLLSPQVRRTFVSLANSYWDGSAAVDHLPLYLTETNTYSDGGVPGISNTFVSSLWMVGLLLDAAASHVKLAAVQEARGTEPYDAIGPSGRPKPVYYGMLFFHSAVTTAGSGSARILEDRIDTARSLTSYAVRRPDGSLAVIVINQGTRSARVRAVAGGTYRAASLYRLRAPSLASNSGVTMGGHALSPVGTWSGGRTPLVIHGHPSAGSFWVRQASAVCVVFKSPRR